VSTLIRHYLHYRNRGFTVVNAIRKAWTLTFRGY